jgi:hypothetical protein
MQRLIPVTGGGTYSIAKLLSGSSAASTGQNLQEDSCTFLVDTSEAATTLILPEGKSLVNINVKFFIVDATGNAATNPITIACASESDVINGNVSLIISTNKANAWVTGAGNLTPAATFQWIATLGGVPTTPGGGTSFGKFKTSGTGTVYNIETILGFAVTGVLPVMFDTAVLTPDGYTFDPESQNLTFTGAGQDGIWVQFGYTTA